MKRLNTILLSGLAWVGFAGTPAVAEESFVGATVTRMVDPIFPVMLSSQGIVDGTAVLLVEIDTQGELSDWITIADTDPDFVRAIDRVIDRWEFTPATRNGVPVASGLLLTVVFKSEGLVMTINGPHMTNVYLSSLHGGPRVQPRVANLSALDQIPEPVDVVRPIVDQEIPEGERSGLATFQFFIDEEGDVRLPVLLDFDGDIRLAYAAYDALLQWQFMPPTVKGKPSVVRAKQEFRFNFEEEATRAAISAGPTVTTGW